MQHTSYDCESARFAVKPNFSEQQSLLCGVLQLSPHFRLCLFDLPLSLGVLLNSIGSTKMKLLHSQGGKWHLPEYIIAIYSYTIAEQVYITRQLELIVWHKISHFYYFWNCFHSNRYMVKFYTLSCKSYQDTSLENVKICTHMCMV